MKFKKYSTATDTYTTLPATFQTSGADVENYQVYGASSGVGEETENLFDGYGTFGKYNPDNTISVIDAKTISITGIYYVYQIYQVKPNTDYYLYTIPYSDDSQAGRMITGVNNAGTAPNMSDVVNNYSPTNFSFSFNTGERNYIALILYSSASNVAGTVTYSNTMLVEGSIVPASFIPHGYKIPILCQSGNLWNGEIEQGGINNGGSLVESAMRVRSCITNLVGGQTYFIKSNQNIRMIYAYYGMWTDTKIGLVLDNNTYKTEYTFKLPEGANSIGVALMTYPETNIVPSDVTTAILANSSNYDLFIGDSKLYEDEYVDFSEQKVYKRTENLFTEEGSGLVQVTAEGAERYGKDIGVLSAGTYTIDYTLSSLALVTLWLHTVKNGVYTSKQIVSHRYTFTLNEDIDVIFRTSQQYDTTWQTLGVTDIMLVSGSTAPASYIPYLQPTDPPAPFPALHTYIGENNLSVDTTIQPEKVALTVAAWREIEAKKYVNGGWTDIVVRRYENGAWVPSPIPENNIANLQGLLTLLEDHWLPGVNDYRSMILVRTNRNDDTANQLCYMLTCYSTNPSPHFASEFLNNRYWLNDYAVPYSSTNFYLRKFSWTQGGGWVYDGDEDNKRDDYFVPIDSNTYNVYLLRLGSSTQYDNNAGYQYFYDLSAYF